MHVIMDQQQDPNVYLIKQQCGKSPLQKFNCQQLYDPQNTQDELKDLYNPEIHANVPFTNKRENKIEANPSAQ